MLNLNLFIHGVGLIAPAADAAPDATGKRLAAEPDYTAWIPPMQLRRTSKVVRMGIGAARRCTEATGIERPDAISIGTAMGCLQDTEFFLGKMVGQEEKMLTPTAFIQSTHNTVGGQIALLMGCHGHNMTYVHRGHSFEQAVMNAKLYLNDHPGHTVLAGGIDELTPNSHLLMQRAGFYSSAAAAPDGGVVAGEGAAFFSLSSTPVGALLEIVAMTVFTAPSPEAAFPDVAVFLEQWREHLSALSRLIIGSNANSNDGAFYQRVESMLPGLPTYHFKQQSGEYATASAIGLALAVNGAHSGDENAPGSFIVLVNHYCDHYSCWLLHRP